MSYNLKYRRQKIKSKNFIPVIKFIDDEPQNIEIEEPYHPPIEEYKEIITEEEQIRRDEAEEKEQELIINDNLILLEKLMNGLKRVKSVRLLEMWIKKNKNKIQELHSGNKNELLDFINNKYYVKR